jgi:hypothetical protein
MNAEEYDWLGIIFPEDVKSNVTFITPMAFYNQEGTWEVISPDARRQWFPSNGKAVIFDKNFPVARTNRLLLFRPERNMQITDAYSNSYGYSNFLVSSNLQPPRLAQLFDWTAKITNTFDVPDLLDQGLSVRECLCQRIYIQCSSRLFGPIKLEKDADREIYRPREYIQSANTGGQPLFVWMYTKPEDGLISLTDTNRRATFLDESFLYTPTGKEDWSLPQVTIKQVLVASNEALDGIEDNVHLVDKRIRDLVRLSSQEGPHAIHLDVTTLKRARYILSSQIDRLHELQSFIEQLSSENPLLKIAREIEIQVRSQQIESEAAFHAQDQIRQLQQLQGAVQVAQEKLDHLQAAAEETEKNQQQTIMAMHAFEQTMHERLASLKEEPLRTLAEHHIIASLLPILADRSLQPAFEMRISPPHSSIAHDTYDVDAQKLPSISGLIWHSRNDTERIKTTLQALQLQRWRQIAQQSGVKSRDIRICVAALLAGLIPVIEGDAAISTLRAVAQILASGRSTLVPVPLTALSTLDFFGSIDQHQQAFIPIHGLADCILEAQAHSDELVIVILEGIDRIPGMSTYVPLLRQYFESRQLGTAQLNNTSLPLFHPRAVAKGDPYLSLAQYTWPDNILLTATVDNDLNNFSLPSLCDSWTVPWETAFKEGAAYSRRTTSYSSASVERWMAWRDEVYTNSVNHKDFHGSLNQRQKLLYSALTLLGIEGDDLLHALIWQDELQEGEVEEGVL